MKLWLTTTENKCFVKMLWHLLGEYVKTTVLLVCSICTVHRFFYFFILFFSQSSICALFSTEFLHCSYSVFHCSSTVPFWLATLSFFFFFKFLTVATKPRDIVATVVFFFFFSNWFMFFFFNIDLSWHLYCYTDTTNFIVFPQLLTCQFLTSRNKIIKYEPVASHNWK